MRLLRSPREIMFRLRQEAANLRYAIRPPRLESGSPSPSVMIFPDPASVAAKLRGSAYAAEVERIADSILGGQLPVLGFELKLDEPFAWRSDAVNGKSSEIRYIRRIPYLTFDHVGDHKIVWEPNRHQHFVLLAQAYLFTGREDFLAAIVRQWDHWIDNNPLHQSINWTSALEVAFRAMSWLWTLHLAGNCLPPDTAARFTQALFQHGCHLEYNLSEYFSPNTHLLGEAVVLHAIATLYPSMRGAGRWKAAGAAIVRRELDRQVLDDGAHFEQSSYYHVYALDFFLLHWLLADRPEAYRPKLIQMAEYLRALLGPGHRIPLIGDDDGGRLFHPYGPRDEFGRATLATCSVALQRCFGPYTPDDAAVQAAWWLPLSDSEASAPRPPASTLFPSTGIAVLAGQSLWALADAGGFGPFRAGHSHSDSLSLVLRNGERDVLVDAGTFSYVDAHWRDWFRSSAAHNTLRIDGRDQSVPHGLFAWEGKPVVSVEAWHSTDELTYLDAICSYAGTSIKHRRRFLLIQPDLLVILDEANGGDGEHLVEQFWHTAETLRPLERGLFDIGAGTTLAIPAESKFDIETGGVNGWRSLVYGDRRPCPVLCVQYRTRLPASMAAAIAPHGVVSAIHLADKRRIRLDGARPLAIEFTASGPPILIKG